MGGFDFFGTRKAAGGSGAGEPAAAKSAPAKPAAAKPASVPASVRTGLADVVGEEALAAARPAGGDGERADGEVIDLTAHDETEQLDVAGLRNAVGS